MVAKELRFFSVGVLLCVRHLPTTFGALLQVVGTNLAVFGVVLATLIGAGLARLCTGFGQRIAVVRPPGHKSGVKRREVGHVSTNTSAFLHIGIATTFVSAPFTHLGRFVTVFDTIALFVAQAPDLGDSLQWTFHYYRNPQLRKPMRLLSQTRVIPRESVL